MPGHVRRNIVVILPLIIPIIMISGACNPKANNPETERRTLTATFRETSAPYQGGMNYIVETGETGITPALDPSFLFIYDHSKIPDSSSDSIEFWIAVKNPLKKQRYI